MDDKDKKDPRSRDDSRLRHQLDELGQWMAERGVENLPLDWEAIAREKRAERLRWRLSEAFKQLLDPLAGLSAELAARIQQMTEASPLAAAALRIAIHADGQTSDIAGEPGVMIDGADLQVAAASAADRMKSGLAADSPINIVSFVSPGFRGARVHVDAEQQRVVVEMQAAEPEPLMLLIPEDVDKPVMPGVFQRHGRRARAVFENVRPGPYLLTVHTPPV